jgi:hypothetical protein
VLFPATASPIPATAAPIPATAAPTSAVPQSALARRGGKFAILGGAAAFFLAGLLLRKGRHLALPT